MTRFNISLQEGVDMVLWAIEHAWGGEIWCPRFPSYRITDVANAIGPECRQEIVGIRPGEKIHEEMITASDSLNTVDLGRYFAILPSAAPIQCRRILRAAPARDASKPSFAYDSGRNPDFLTIPALRQLIEAHVRSNDH